MNRSLTVANVPRTRTLAWPDARGWAFALVVLTVWSSVAPVAYVFHIGSIGVVPYEIFEGLAVVLCGVLWLRGGMKFAAFPGVWWFGAFMLLTTMSAWLAVDARAALVLLGRYWLSWLVIFLVPLVVTTRRQLRWFLVAMLVQGLVLVSVNIAAGLGATSETVRWFALTEFPKNEYATYLAFVVAIGLAVWNTDILQPRLTGAGLAMAALAIISWPLTFSRAGLLAIVGTLVLLVWFVRTRVVARQVAGLAVAGVVAWALLPSDVRANSSRAVSSLAHVMGSLRAGGLPGASASGDPDPFSRTMNERLVLDRAALAAIARHPLTGVGLTRWQAQSPVTTPVWDVKRGEAIVVGAVVHNQFLYMAAESGLPTLVAYLGFLVVFWRGALAARAHADPALRFLLNALLACSMSLLVALLTMPGASWEWVELGLLVAVERLARLGAEPAAAVRAA